MGRGDLSDAEWERLRPFLPVSNGRCGRWRDHRQVIDGILHRVRTGVQWRDLPERFGPWKTVYERLPRHHHRGRRRHLALTHELLRDPAVDALVLAPGATDESSQITHDRVGDLSVDDLTVLRMLPMTSSAGSPRNRHVRGVEGESLQISGRARHSRRAEAPGLATRQSVPPPVILPVNWTLRVAVVPDAVTTAAVSGLKIRS
ncbi:transposase [Streptomyces sp. NBC_00090]|uniref:transposase n=1 Tax=Streptomyces sp. NBC_00090 TaxID=2903619 RepID=UPI0032510D99